MVLNCAGQAVALSPATAPSRPIPARFVDPTSASTAGRDPNGYKASDPRLVLEVLSPTTRDFDSIRKLEEYKTIAGLEYILFVEPNEPSVAIWSRSDGAWAEARVIDLEAKVEMPKLGIDLAMRAIYEDVEFPPAPRLFAVDEPR